MTTRTRVGRSEGSEARVSSNHTNLSTTNETRGLRSSEGRGRQGKGLEVGPVGVLHPLGASLSLPGGRATPVSTRARRADARGPGAGGAGRHSGRGPSPPVTRPPPPRSARPAPPSSLLGPTSTPARLPRARGAGRAGDRGVASRGPGASVLAGRRGAWGPRRRAGAPGHYPRTHSAPLPRAGPRPPSPRPLGASGERRASGPPTPTAGREVPGRRGDPCAAGLPLSRSLPSPAPVASLACTSPVA